MEALNAIPGVGEVVPKAYVDYFSSEIHVKRFKDLLEELMIPKEEGEEKEQIFAG